MGSQIAGRPSRGDVQALDGPRAIPRALAALALMHQGPCPLAGSCWPPCRWWRPRPPGSGSPRSWPGWPGRRPGGPRSARLPRWWSYGSPTWPSPTWAPRRSGSSRPGRRRGGSGCGGSAPRGLGVTYRILEPLVPRLLGGEWPPRRSPVRHPGRGGRRLTGVHGRQAARPPDPRASEQENAELLARGT